MGAILIDNVTKRYELHPRRDLLARTAIRKIRRTSEPFYALRNISAQIRAGEKVAIVGGNGAGKSTLLGIVAGVTAPTSGTVTRRGRISALLELGTGFHPDLTGEENIRLNASLLGLTRSEIDAKFDSIVAFSELERFIGEPLRTYSSGMMARLGFSTAIHVDPEILVLDEVLAVGDKAFQAKCIDRVTQMAASGATLLVVSHQLTLVKSMCTRALWLERGQLKMDASIDEVAAAYEPAAPAPAATPAAVGFATPHTSR